jgi:hypothetical protein
MPYNVTGWKKQPKDQEQRGHKLESGRLSIGPKFRNDAEALLQKCGKQLGTSYRLKHQLIEAR